MASPFSPDQLAYLEAHRNDTRVPQILVLYSVPIAAATISTVLRLWAKHYARHGIALDDYLIVAATLCLIGQCVTGLALGPSHGMGRHVIVVSSYDQMVVRKGDFIFSHFYDIALTTVKLGILAFYWRVFVNQLFRRVVVATASFVLLWGVGITVTLFLACRPLASYWDANVPGKCLKMDNFVYFTNISNLITDVWIFLMPIPMIWQLQLQTKKKLLLCLIFCVGLATCIVSSVRLTVVLGHGNPDFTWFYVPLGGYSVFEPLGGILCTNLPIIWHMFRRHNKVADQSSNLKSRSSRMLTIGPQRQRFSIRLGITTRDRTFNDSGLRSTTDPGGDMGRPGEFQRLESMENQMKPDPRIWTPVEKASDDSTEYEDNAIPLKPGMKKTVWNVRR